MTNKRLLITLAGAVAVAGLALPLFPKPTPPPPAEVNRFLWCIEQVEGHKVTDLGGVYALSRLVWMQHTNKPYALSAKDPTLCRQVAERHYSWLHRSLLELGFHPTAYRLAACWRWGLDGGVRFFLNEVPVDYAERFVNLYNSNHYHERNKAK